MYRSSNPRKQDSHTSTSMCVCRLQIQLESSHSAHPYKHLCSLILQTNRTMTSQGSVCRSNSKCTHTCSLPLAAGGSQRQRARCAQIQHGCHCGCHCKCPSLFPGCNNLKRGLYIGCVAICMCAWRFEARPVYRACGDLYVCVAI